MVQDPSIGQAQGQPSYLPQINTGAAPAPQYDSKGQPISGQAGGAVTAQKYDAEGYPVDQNAYWAKDDPIYGDGVAYNDPDPSTARVNPVDPYKDRAGYDRVQQRIEEAHKRWAGNQTAHNAYQQAHTGERQVAPAAPQAAPRAFQSAGLDLTKQGKGESYIDSILSHYGENGVPQTSHNAQDAYDKFQASSPADMSKYYDNASRLLAAKTTSAAAARGNYGSSGEMGGLIGGETSLRAQQAKDEAGYGLSRFSALGSSATAADAQNNTANGIQYQWTQGLANLAGHDQQLGEDRNQSLFGNNFQVANAKAGVYGQNTTDALNDDKDAFDASEKAGMGAPSDAVSFSNQNQNTNAAQTAQVYNAGATGVANATKSKDW